MPNWECVDDILGSSTVMGACLPNSRFVWLERLPSEDGGFRVRSADIEALTEGGLVAEVADEGEAKDRDMGRGLIYKLSYGTDKRSNLIVTESMRELTVLDLLDLAVRAQVRLED